MVYFDRPDYSDYSEYDDGNHNSDTEIPGVFLKKFKLVFYQLASQLAMWEDSREDMGHFQVAYLCIFIDVECFTGITLY